MKLFLHLVFFKYSEIFQIFQFAHLTALNRGVDQDSTFAPSNFSLKCCVGAVNWDARKSFSKDIFRSDIHIPLSIINE